jgi:hypothetical protein
MSARIYPPLRVLPLSGAIAFMVPQAQATHVHLSIGLRRKCLRRVRPARSGR